jgi:hypothetical protein
MFYLFIYLFACLYTSLFCQSEVHPEDGNSNSKQWWYKNQRRGNIDGSVSTYYFWKQLCNLYFLKIM